MRNQKPWKMPKWMEQYRELIVTNGGSVENMVDDETLCQVNSVRALVAFGVKAQVSLLCRLHDAEKLG